MPEVRSHSWKRMAPGMSAPGRYMVPSMSTRKPSTSEVCGSYVDAPPTKASSSEVASPSLSPSRCRPSVFKLRFNLARRSSRSRAASIATLSELPEPDLRSEGEPSSLSEPPEADVRSEGDASAPSEARSALSEHEERQDPPEADLRSEGEPSALSELPEADVRRPAAADGQFAEKWPGTLLGVDGLIIRAGLIIPRSQLVCTFDEPSSELAVAILPDDPTMGGPSFSVRSVFVGDPSCEEQRTSGTDFLRPSIGGVPSPPPDSSERSRLRNGTLPPELRSPLTSSSRRASRLSFVSRGLGERLTPLVAVDSIALSLPPRRALRKPASQPMSRHESAEATAPSTKATSGLVLRAATHPGCARQEPWACVVSILERGRGVGRESCSRAAASHVIPPYLDQSAGMHVTRHKYKSLPGASKSAQLAAPC